MPADEADPRAPDQLRHEPVVGAELIEQPSKLPAFLSVTSDDDIRAGLHRITNKNATIVLFWVELFRRHRDNRFDLKDLPYAYSLEHLMPQKWETHWSQIPEKRHSNGDIMADAEAKADRAAKIYWIGNMTLLTASLNSSLRNDTFEKKMKGQGRRKGIEAYASLSITLDDVVTPYRAGKAIWDEDRIVSRTAEPTKEILAIWPGSELAG